MQVNTRFNNHEYASVFKSAAHAGPALTGNSRTSGYPEWPDFRFPGSTDPNMEARKIMMNWTPDQMRRFQMFVEDYRRQNRTPWGRDYFNKTAPGIEASQAKIIKCKMELVKRILRIKMTGPLSMEDWCLLFLYHDHRINIPQDVETLIRPMHAHQNELDFLSGERNRVEVPMYRVRPAEVNKHHMANQFLPGFESGDGAVDDENKLPFYSVGTEQQATRFRLNFPFFPREATNRQAEDRYEYFDRIPNAGRQYFARDLAGNTIVPEINRERGRELRRIRAQVPNV